MTTKAFLNFKFQEAIKLRAYVIEHPNDYPEVPLSTAVSYYDDEIVNYQAALLAMDALERQTQWTVMGVDCDGELFIAHVTASSHETALRACAHRLGDDERVACVEGHHRIYTPADAENKTSPGAGAAVQTTAPAIFTEYEGGNA